MGAATKGLENMLALTLPMQRKKRLNGTSKRRLSRQG